MDSVDHFNFFSVHHALLSDHALLQEKLFEEEALFFLVEVNPKSYCRSFSHWQEI